MRSSTTLQGADGPAQNLKALRSTIKALFANPLADEELDGLIEQLTERGAIKISEGKVHYELPS